MGIFSLPSTLALAAMASFVFSPHARAVDILTTAEHTFFSPNDARRIGIEIEFQNLSVEQALEIVQNSLGGPVEKIKVKQLTTIHHYEPDGTAVYNELEAEQYVLKNTKIGKVIVKPETNQIDETKMGKDRRITIEVISDPIRLPEIEILQTTVDDLARAGAKGTSSKAAVSIQVNAEIANGIKEEAKPKEIVNLLRSYFQPEHRQQINASMKVPKNRKPYVADISDGMLKKIMNPDYNPSWRELYDDYIYRQSLEVLGIKKAWTMPIDEAREMLLVQKSPVVPTVVKQNSVRITSLLAELVPEDPMSKEMVVSGWIKPGMYLEFREWNNDFNIKKPVKQTLGLLRAAKEYGFYEHDALLAELSGVEKAMIQELRVAASKAKKPNQTLGFRYFLADPNTSDRKDYEKYKKEFYDKNDIVGFLSPKERGAGAVYVPGESVVIHRRPIHANNIRGKHNPGLINANVAQALENKYVEAKFWEEFAPKAMAETHLLSDLSGGSKDAEKIAAALAKKFPDGWVLKGVWDLGTEDGIITSNDDIAAEVKAYKKSDFDKFKAKVDTDVELKNSGREYYADALSEHKNFKGWKIAQMLEKQQLLIVQAKLPIDKEFRVEVLAGHVLNHGSTIDRYAYKFDYDAKKAKVSPEEVKAAEKYVRELLIKLPPELRGTPFAFDVALTKGGDWRLIESNFGSNSNFLYEEDWKPSIRSLSEFIDHYPELEKRGLVRHGMTNEEQMKWLEQKFSDWKINKDTMYHGFAFTKTQVLDTDFPEKSIDEKKFQITGDNSCQRKFAKLRSKKR